MVMHQSVIMVIIEVMVIVNKAIKDVNFITISIGGMVMLYAMFELIFFIIEKF